jgi:hypothetical protein
VDGAEFDSLLPGLIAGARAQAEQDCRRAWAQQVWRTELDDWPAYDAVIPLYRPSAAAVTYWNGSAWTTLASNQYVLWANGRGASVAQATGVSWPTLPEVAAGPRVRVDLTIGEPTPATVPEGVKTYIKACVAAWLRMPEAHGAAQQLQANPLLGALLDPWRVF